MAVDYVHGASSDEKPAGCAEPETDDEDDRSADEHVEVNIILPRRHIPVAGGVHDDLQSPAPTNQSFSKIKSVGTYNRDCFHMVTHTAPIQGFDANPPPCIHSPTPIRTQMPKIPVLLLCHQESNGDTVG
jgi:hypothetical protein